MRIVHTEASRGWGGQEIRVLEESAGMIARGHQVTLIAPREAEIFRRAAERGIPAVALPIGRRGLRGVLALRRWLKDHAADVVNSHSSTDSWLAALALRALQPAPPLVRTRHISAPIPDNIATRWLYRRATVHVVTTGERLRAQVIRETGIEADRVTSVPTGIDVARFVPGDRRAARQQTGLPQERKLIGIIATLRSWKGHRYLIEAFAKLARPETGLVIVGDGPQREALHELIDKLGLGERVSMPGNQNDVLPWLQAFDVFVLPSYANEGVPQALLQAMLCGLPCVTTAVGSIGEIAQHETTALLVEPRDAESLARALARLLDEPQLGAKLAANALPRIRADYSRERMLDRMEAIFRAVVHG